MKKIILLSLIIFLGANYETVSYGIIKGDNVRIRSDKNLSSKVVGVLNRNDKVIIIGDSEKEFEIDGQSYLWYNISYKGKTGWVYGKFLNILPTEPRDNKYYVKLLEDRLNAVFTKDYDYNYSFKKIKDSNSNNSQQNNYLDLSEPGYLYLKSEYSNEFCLDIIKEVYQYDNDKLKLIMTGTDVFKIHKNFIFNIKTILESSDRLYSIKVYDMSKPLKNNEMSSDNCIYEKVFEMEESKEDDDVKLYFDYDNLTIRVYMEKLKQTVSVLKFKNGVFQP